jgi:uncharacterized membrane protein SirB2
VTLAEFYPVARGAHLALAALSVGLFMARWFGAVLERAWVLGPLARRASVAIDSLLLGAGVLLWVSLQLNPLRDQWLAVKLALIVAYIVLGSFAIKRAKAPRLRAMFGWAALACIAAVVGVAVSHDAALPLRWLGVMR